MKEIFFVKKNLREQVSWSEKINYFLHLQQQPFLAGFLATGFFAGAFLATGFFATMCE